MAVHFLGSTKRYGPLFLSILLLLLGSTQMNYSVEGSRPLLDLSEVAKGGENEEMVMVGSRVGSRPPNCKERCSSCGHCEAVQVPLLPLEKRKKKMTTMNSRGDEYSSNYKPMNWKCKCGGIILNP